MLADRIETAVEKPRMHAALKGAVAVAGLLAAFLYGAEMRSSPVVENPNILEPNAGNVMAGMKLSGRGEFGEIQQ